MTAFSAMWQALEPIGRDPATGGYRRYAWTRTDHDLREWFAAECARRGLDLVEDRMGNQWAWWGNPDAAGAGVVTGSHLDSVPDGGAFDGPLGVAGALAAVDALQEQDFRPVRPIGVVNFVDEEGSRFGVACAGSRVITGRLDADRARSLLDADGVTMAEAIRRAGRDPGDLGPDPDTLARVGTFVELHIEQGRGLVDLGSSVAVGSTIWPHGRWRLDIPGEANHAGTTRLTDRRDAMVGFATICLTARSAAEQHGCLATVGKIAVRPGAVNAIPALVTGWLDARGADADALRALVAELSDQVSRLGGHVHEESWTPPTRFDADLVQRLSQSLRGAPVLGTGAGHDAGILAASGITAAMLFVRNPTGVSHSPDEWAEPSDCQAGVRALTEVLADLAGAVA